MNEEDINIISEKVVTAMSLTRILTESFKTDSSIKTSDLWLLSSVIEKYLQELNTYINEYELNDKGTSDSVVPAKNPSIKQTRSRTEISPLSK